jgi:hypothetical protein
MAGLMDLLSLNTTIGVKILSVLFSVSLIKGPTCKDLSRFQVRLRVYWSKRDETSVMRRDLGAGVWRLGDWRL